jgi:nucleoid-associated protein YgaU
MSTRVKIGIAAAIVAAVVGLIVLDQRTAAAPADRTASPAGPPAAPGTSGLAIETDFVREATGAIERTMENAVRERPATPQSASRPPAPADPAAAPPPAPAAETYEVKAGDMLWTIAEKKYGNGALYSLITKANSLSDGAPLRVGQKLVLPPKPSNDTLISTEPQTEGDQRTYVIQAGDSLVRLAQRFYRNGQLALKLYEANRDVIENADVLVAGTKIVLPDFRTAPEAPTVEAGTAGAPAAAGRRSYRVKSGDSLWKIAKTCSNGRNIVDTMERIVELNREKLHSTGTPLQADWVLVLPD